MEAFRRINVANACNGSSFHDKRLDRDPPASRSDEKVGAVEGVAKRLRAEILEQGVLQWICGGPEHGSEAAVVSKTYG